MGRAGRAGRWVTERVKFGDTNAAQTRSTNAAQTGSTDARQSGETNAGEQVIPNNPVPKLPGATGRGPGA